MTQFGFGLMDKTVKGHIYSYFWTYDGSGHKSETYLGRADKPRTQKKALETKLTYLEGLHRTIEGMIDKTRVDLEQLLVEEVKT